MCFVLTVSDDVLRDVAGIGDDEDDAKEIEKPPEVLILLVMGQQRTLITSVFDVMERPTHTHTQPIQYTLTNQH